VFVDVDPGSYNISPEAMEAAITPKTRGAVVVHNGGYPADMDRVLEIARRRGIRIVEDAAHAHGSEWKGRRVGALGDIGTFSFQMGKTITAGEGGLVLTNDKDLAEKAYSYHHIGRLSGRPFYEFHKVASNLRMTEWQGAILLAQLSRLDEQTETRERNTRYLAKGLSEIPGVAPIDRDPRVTRWGFYYWNFKYRQEEFDDVPRDVFLKAVQAEGVPISVGAHGQPIYRNPVFRDEGYDKVVCPEAERIYATEALSIGHRSFLGDLQDMDQILEAIRKVRANTAELRKLQAS
jgi:dTDP-4-amino-4,6-dideoxygalactose transaminase